MHSLVDIANQWKTWNDLFASNWDWFHAHFSWICNNKNQFEFQILLCSHCVIKTCTFEKSKWLIDEAFVPLKLLFRIQMTNMRVWPNKHVTTWNGNLARSAVLPCVKFFWCQTLNKYNLLAFCWTALHCSSLNDLSQTVCHVELQMKVQPFEQMKIKHCKLKKQSKANTFKSVFRSFGLFLFFL